MLDPRLSSIHDLEDVASMLKQHGDVCVLWKRGYTATFKWFGNNPNQMVNLKERRKHLEDVLNSKTGLA